MTTVKPMHYLYVEPTRSKADIVINSGKNDVAFDLFVSKISMELEKRKQGELQKMLAVVWKHCCDDAAELANESCCLRIG